MEVKKWRNLCVEERAKRQIEVDEHFSTKDQLIDAESRIRELESLITKSTNRTEGYSAIITKLLDGFRKASDEYEKVRRQKT
jgi:arginine deiminase